MGCAAHIQGLVMAATGEWRDGLCCAYPRLGHGCYGRVEGWAVLHISKVRPWLLRESGGMGCAVHIQGLVMAATGE